jgi:hypothetical protein
LKPILVFALLALSVILPGTTFAEEGTAQVDVDGTTFEVSYDATGLTVDEMEADTSSGTLTIFVTTEDIEGNLEITLERNFLDSQTDGEDDEFLVLADGIDVPFEEEKTDSTRVLAITVPSGTNSLDIISLGATGFGTAEETPEEIEEPVEEVPEETPEEVPEEPETQCGPGTVLQDGVCVLEEQPEEPVEEVPEETPEEVPEEPETQCGPGTVLQDGVCVLDERCGPGTVFVDGQCVLEEAPTTSSRGMAFDLVAPAIAAFIIAFIVMIILWAIGRACRKKTNAKI